MFPNTGGILIMGVNLTSSLWTVNLLLTQVIE